MKFQPTHTSFIYTGNIKQKDLPPHLQQALYSFDRLIKNVENASHPAIKVALLPVLEKVDEILYHELQAYHKPTLLPASTSLELEALAIELELELTHLEGLGKIPAPKFSAVTELERSQIIIRPELFQGRLTKFAQETVDKILQEGYDKSQEPIVVWFDEKLKNYVVISGHSRWEASEMLYKKGDTSLKKMPVKIFLGTKEEALDYALFESNRSSTQEGLKSDIKAYKKAVEKGYNKQYLKGIFKPESRLRLLQDLSHLNENGRFIEHLGEDSEKSFPFLQRNAQWVGILRKMYPTLSHSHEKEMFDYLYKDATRIKVRKETFFDLVEKKVTKIDFNYLNPLNLENIVASSAYTDPVREMIKEIDRNIEQLSKERELKEGQIIRARKEGKEHLIAGFGERISQISQAILRELGKKDKLEADARNMERQITEDLFSAPQSNITKSKADFQQLKLEALALEIELELL